MITYLKNIILFVFTFLVISNMIQCFVPYYIGNAQFETKYQSFKTESDLYNTIFLGNSQINRHVIPSVFDKYTNNKTKSYNLATDATPFTELSYLTENVIRNEKAKNIFLVLFRSAPITQNNLHKPRLNYYHDLRRTRLAFRLSQSSYEQKKFHLISFIHKYTFSFIGLIFKERYPIDSEYYNQGFLSYDEEANILSVEPKDQSEQQMIEILIPQKINIPYNETLSDEYLIMQDECLRLSQLATSMHKNLYFIFLPNDMSYKSMNLPNSLSLGTGESFPEYFNPEIYYNRTHLNGDGAILYSKQLAKVYMQQKNQNLVNGNNRN